MDKLKMHTPNLADENFQRLAAMFPNAVTETINEDGEVVRAIDADVLRQEISCSVVEGMQERYQFTWPDKKKSVVLANQPIAKTLRLDRSKSVGRDGTPGSIDTENIYIEGDNLDALKLLRETYLCKVKLIYIDPPYNTGSDTFVYDDDWAIPEEEYSEIAEQYDDNGNMLFDLRQNNETNGRFHTDWLNMLYPRLRLAKDLLSNDGVIFISIDNHEVENIRKICNEIFGESNFISCIANVNNPKGRSDEKNIATAHEYILVYQKREASLLGFEPEEKVLKRYNKTDSIGRKYRHIDLRKTGDSDRREDRPKMFYYFHYNQATGEFYPTNKYEALEGWICIKPIKDDGTDGRWRVGMDTALERISELEPIYMSVKKRWTIMERDYLSDSLRVKATSAWTHKDVNSERGTEEFVKLGFDKNVFPRPKPLGTIERIILLSTGPNDIIMDFFSGSATTAHAIFQRNIQDGYNRKFILVQIPEPTWEYDIHNNRVAKKNNPVAYNEGYETICEIGEERIRRAGKKILSDPNNSSLLTPNSSLDVGFRVFRVDSSNMNDVYYSAAELKQEQIDLLAENIKSDRTPEDLLIQVMLDMGILLSSKIEETEIAGKKVFSVADGYLIACFDKDVTEETVTEIAKRKPFYAVFRDSSMASDSVITNFEQIFETYSPKTERKVL